MVNLFEKEGNKILMMLGYGDRTRAHAEVCVFNNTHPECNTINKVTVTKIMKHLLETENLKDRRKIGLQGYNFQISERKIHKLLYFGVLNYHSKWFENS